jgi:hypothetical protein
MCYEKIYKLDLLGTNWKACKNQKGPTQGWGSKNRKKDSMAFVGLFFENNIYLKQIYMRKLNSPIKIIHVTTMIFHIHT